MRRNYELVHYRMSVTVAQMPLGESTGVTGEIGSGVGGTARAGLNSPLGSLWGPQLRGAKGRRCRCVHRYGPEDSTESCESRLLRPLPW